MAKMKQLVSTGIRRVPEMQRHVANYVHELFAGEAVPPQSDARFWPGSKAVLNCIYRETQKMRLIRFKYFCSDFSMPTRTFILLGSANEYTAATRCLPLQYVLPWPDEC